MITIDPADLAALVVMLAREHFGYNSHGAAALRAYRGLEAAIADDAAAIVIAATTDNQHEGRNHEQRIETRRGGDPRRRSQTPDPAPGRANQFE